MIDQGVVFKNNSPDPGVRFMMKPPMGVVPRKAPNPHHHGEPPRKKPLQFKRATSDTFCRINPVLANGEPAYEWDTKKFKIGDGKTRYTHLPYIGNGGGEGKSAYELWLDQDNEGTVEDFLDSLIGPAGKSSYEIWLGLGNEGSVVDFVNSIQGAPGPTGKSAYEVWVEAGNEGTISDYLQSLHGKSAYEIWLDLGNTGTEEQYIESLHGKSAYEIWLDHGHEGSEAEFIQYLVTTSWEQI